MAKVTSHPPGAFCWIELGTTDQNAAKAFYGKLFGWTFVDLPMGEAGVYTMFKLKARDVGTAYTLDPRQHPDVPPTDIPGTGRFAVFADPQGAMFAIYRE